MKCDHQPLKKYFTDSIQNTKIDPWSLTLQEFNLKFIWIEGTANKAADCLSQLHHPNDEQDIIPHDKVSTMNDINVILDTFPMDTIPLASHLIPQPNTTRPRITSLLLFVRSIFVSVLLVCWYWWNGYPKTIKVDCNVCQGSDVPCTFCAYDISDVNQLAINLIQSIAVDSDNPTKQKTFLKEAAQIGISDETLKSHSNQKILSVWAG